MSFNCLELHMALDYLEKDSSYLSKDDFDSFISDFSFRDHSKDFSNFVSILCFYEDILETFSSIHSVVDGVSSQTLHNFLSFSSYPFYALAFEKYEYVCDCVLSMLKVHPKLIDSYPKNSKQRKLLDFLLRADELDNHAF
jgi:hypothetical protein